VTKTQEAAIQAASVALGVATGATPPVYGAKQLLGLAIDMIPVDQLKEFLTERDRVFADLTVDVAEQMKLEGVRKP